MRRADKANERLALIREVDEAIRNYPPDTCANVLCSFLTAPQIKDALQLIRGPR